MTDYQFNFAHNWPSMYDKEAREQKAKRIVKVLADYFGEDRLKDLTLLDIGSSTGIMDNILARSFKKVIGTDIDEGGVEYAKKNFKKENLEFYVKDAMKLDLPSNSYDIVVCAQVYEHVPDTNKLFSEIYRVLKTDGVCYLAALNKIWPIEPHYKLPFLSWVPKKLADLYIRLFRNLPEYPETLRTYWDLRKLTKKFLCVEYTEKILQNPIKYSYTGIIATNFFVKNFVKIGAPLVKFFSPTFFWLLVKKS
ncbi:MAG: class I SAM-dependent methyltransferase [Candidatus Daviesbacteria bacterium]|nr:class I SAM-dependent methyltransferase [Candidatus Daviesbacteria bacterium]